MEFRFRAVDKRPPNYYSYSSSSFNYLSGQAFRPNPSIDFNRSRPDQFQLELEKAQIREEIIASEIARRRALEAEVRRELMAEREMVAMHLARETGLSFEQRLTMRLDPRRPFMPHFSDHHRWRREELFNLLPPPPPPMLPPPVTEVLDPEVKATSEENKNKLIMLAKPDPHSVVGAKQKTPPLGGTDKLPLPLINIKKKPDEWSCAICQVSATSEKGLTEHLQGKKHRAKEARLRADRMEKISRTNPTALPKEPRKRPKAAEMPTNKAGLESETGTDEKLPQLNVDGSDQELEDGEKLKNQEDELPIQIKKAVRFRRKYGNAVDKVQMTQAFRKKKRFKFWCEMCLVGAYSEVIMEGHKNGKKHIARLQELDENNAAAPADMEASPDCTQMPKDDDLVAKEANTATMQASLDYTQMPKDDDLVANEANDKLMDVPETDSCNNSPVVN